MKIVISFDISGATKNCGVKVDLRTIVNTAILEHNVLCDCVENTRDYVKRELRRMLDKEANK